MKIAVMTLRGVPSFVNQARLLHRVAVEHGYDVEDLNMDSALDVRKQRFDHAIALIPLWARYIFGSTRLCAPWFSQTHYIYGPVDGPFQTNLNLFAVARNYRIVTPSQWCADMLAKNNIPVSKVVPHAIDPSEFVFEESPRYVRMKKLRAKYPNRKILFSNLTPLHRKGFGHLCKAIEILNQRIPKKFVFILHTNLKKAMAISPEARKLKLGIPNLYVEDQYGTLPFRAIAEKTVACDVYVHPSLNEGFGEPILEAMAARRTIVCLDAPAMNELVGDKEAWMFPMSKLIMEKWDNGAVGYLHDYDPADLANAMEYAVTHTKESGEKAEAAHTKSLEYDYRKVYPELLK